MKNYIIISIIIGAAVLWAGESAIDRLSLTYRGPEAATDLDILHAMVLVLSVNIGLVVPFLWSQRNIT